MPSVAASAGIGGPNSDYLTEVRKGNIPGASSFSIVGANLTVPTSQETVWKEGGLYVFPSSGVQMSLSSSDTNDTSAGTGARTVLVTYLDASFVEQTEVVTLNGQTGVNTVATDLFRIQRIVVLTAGSGNANAGIIYIGTGSITVGKPDVVFGLVAIGDNISMHGFFTVPDGVTAFIMLVLGSVETGKFAQTVLLTRAEGGLFIVSGDLDLTSQAQSFPSRVGEGFIAHTDMEYRAVADTGTANVKITTELLLIE